MEVRCKFRDGYVFVFREDDPPTAPSITLHIEDAIELGTKLIAAVLEGECEYLKSLPVMRPQ